MCLEKHQYGGVKEKVKGDEVKDVIMHQVT